MYRWTLRRRLNTMLVLWYLLFIVVTAVLSVAWLSRLTTAEEHDRLLLARTVAGGLESSIIAGVQQDLDRLERHLASLDALAAAALREQRIESPFRGSVYVLDAGHRVVASHPAGVTPLPPGLLAERYTVTPLFADPARGDAELLAAARPFRLGGKAYWLVLDVDPATRPLVPFLPEPSDDESHHVFVIDRSGRVIASHDRRHVLARLADPAHLAERFEEGRPFVTRSGSCPVADDPDERDPVMTIVPLRTAPWAVVVSQHRSRVLAPFSGLVGGALAAGLLLIGMGVLLALLLSRSIVSPISKLSGHAAALERGDLARPIHVAGDLEIEQLSSSLEAARVKLAASMNELQQLNRHLEERIASRTKRLLEQFEQRRALIRRLLAATEDERRRIARELHDEIAQLLTVIQLSLGKIDEANPDVRRARKLAEELQKEIHRIIHDLRPSLIDNLGLSDAIRSHAGATLTGAGLEVSLELDEDATAEPDVEITLFRIFQELATNIIRHAGAEHVSVELYRSGKRLILAVEDDGGGFSTKETGPGAGLIGIRERAELVGGSVTVDSEPGMGTLVKVEVPTRP